jgi:pilus assembly protein CpaB
MLQSAMPPGASIDTPEARGLLIGAMIRRSLGAGETLVSADITRPGDHGFLAAVLGPGMRAITVGVDAVSGTAGLIWPGDRVDVILTEAAGGGDRQHISALRVLTDARVIAIDQQLVQGVTANSSTAPQPLARTVTLEVSDGEAERVAVATHLGSLSLAVRSADRGAATIADAPRVVWGTDISPAQPETTTMAPPTVRLWLGAADGKEFHF